MPSQGPWTLRLHPEPMKIPGHTALIDTFQSIDIFQLTETCHPIEMENEQENVVRKYVDRHTTC
jgi:hypothetical protein